MKKHIVIAALSLLPLAAAAQVTTFNTKPLASIWNPKDIASVEIRIKGRLSTDPLTTHKIIARIPVKLDWTTVVAPRVTVLVPAGQTWFVKSVGLGVTPAKTTGLAAFEVPTLAFAVPHQAPGGQMLALDANVTNVVNLLGPVASTPQPPPAPIGNKMPPALSLTDAQGAKWTLGTLASGFYPLLKGGARVGEGNALCLSGGAVFALETGKGWQQWLNPNWSPHGTTPAGC